MSNDTLAAGRGTRRERFEPILSQARFEGLKAIFDRLSHDRDLLYAGILETNSYEQLMARLGHKLVLARAIHIQDCYSRLGQDGGIKAVLPYHDIPTQSSLPTLLNFDSSLTTTPKAAAFFDALLTEFKKLLTAQA
ncbi:MAG TPA: hypothetical protein VN578_16155 [Candidatus Binatia bacterium]|nr:hypothetical protein [Candidatus Binatia bacterium]